jgi:hypothetical protein
MNAEDYEKTGEWGNWNCISIKDSRLSAQGLPWFQKKEIGFTIIPADQFIAASTKSTTMNTAEQLQQLKADQQKLAEQIKVLEESIKNPYKVGDWVTLTANGLPPGSPSTGNNGKNKKGDTVQVKSIEINTMPKVDQWLVLDDGNGISVNIVRPATKEEIEEATRAKEVKVTIGNGNKQVTISRGKIVAHDSTELSISNVDILADIMKGTKGFSGWSVEFKTVKVGCVDGITYKQLKKIQDEYEKLTSI